MEIALDKIGNRVSAYNASEHAEYFCPICRNSVIFKNGSINVPHFAHKSDACKDTWHYDMSDWHFSMQNRFPEDQREVVIKEGGVTHRADILLKNMIIEFQHSPISIDELQERNIFYRSAGYKIAWVFDVQDQYDYESIQSVDTDNDSLMFKWLNPKRFLRCFPSPKENCKDSMLFFYWVDTDGYESFNRVIWSASDDDDGTPNFKRFIISDRSMAFEVDSHQPLNVEHFFETNIDLLGKRLSSIGCKYTMKRCGVKGYPKNNYICPRTDIFGIKRWGEQGCAYCKHCAAIKEYPKGFVSYCCYPVQVNELHEGHSGYECSGIPVF